MGNFTYFSRENIWRHNMNEIISGTEMVFYPENMGDEPTKGCRKIPFAELAAMGGIL